MRVRQAVVEPLVVHIDAILSVLPVLVSDRLNCAAVFPFSDLGVVRFLKVAGYVLNETALSEWSYAGVPNNTFTDGYDPNLSKFFQMDLNNPTPPAAYQPHP